MNKGCLRPLLYSFGALALLTVGALLWNWSTTSLMFGNMFAMGEGADAAREMRSPSDVLAYVAGHPEQFSLVAYDVARPEEGIYYQADVPRPVAGVPKLLVLAEYARQTRRGLLSPEETVPLDSVRVYQLPGANQGGHQRAVRALRQEGRLQDGRLRMGEAVKSMVRWNDDAAADYLMRRLGADALRRLPERLGLPGAEPPLPSSGVFLSWSDAEREPAERISRYRQMAPEAYRQHVFQLTTALVQDTAFRRRTTERLAETGSRLSLTQQRTLAALTYPQGSARAYAALLARLLADSLSADSVLTPEIAGFMRAQIERSAPGDSADALPVVIGSEAASFPGIVSFAGYARPEGAGGRVVVFFGEDLPTALFYHLMQTGLDKGFEVQLLLDDDFFRRAHERLEGGEAPEAGE